jgi:hypothetical protein
MRAPTVLAMCAAGNLGVLPSPDLDITATLGLVHEHWWAELRAAYGVSNVSSAPLPEAFSAYGRFRFFAGTLAGCWVARHAFVDLGPCAEAEFGAVHGEGVGQVPEMEPVWSWFDGLQSLIFARFRRLRKGVRSPTRTSSRTSR